ncbi:MAG TPA: sigma-70 family RNA polymerase sigma factor [Polyangia bacterium]|jgi:RNA polymerase sigma-70 factor (ECF subfamily)
MSRQTSSAELKKVRFTSREREFVYGVALKYLKNEEDAHDVTQEALLLAFRHQDKFRGDSRFTTWLYRIAATTALMHLRKQRRRPPALVLAQGGDTEEAEREPVSLESSPEERTAAVEQVEQCEASLARLGGRYDEIFRLRFVEGYSEEEIAEQLGLNVATVKTRAYRARTRVRARLARRAA